MLYIFFFFLELWHLKTILWNSYNCSQKILKSHKISKTNWTRTKRQRNNLTAPYQEPPNWQGSIWGDRILPLPNRNVARNNQIRTSICVLSLRSSSFPGGLSLSLLDSYAQNSQGAFMSVSGYYKPEVQLDKLHGTLLIFVYLIFIDLNFTWDALYIVLIKYPISIEQYKIRNHSYHLSLLRYNHY